MNREEIYHKSIQILYDAYFNDTLVHGNCEACAVGNLIAANMGYEYTGDGDNVRWDLPIELKVEGDEWFQLVLGIALGQTGKKQINSTGYKLREIKAIEAAFEQTSWNRLYNDWTEDESRFNGLVAVLEVLKQIHEVTDEDLVKSNHKRFKDHHERKLQVV